MSSTISSEADLLPYLEGVKEDDHLTWEQFGNATLDIITETCRTWGLNPPKIAKVQNIWQRHPKRFTPTTQGK
jgi:hypothetical protein